MVEQPDSLDALGAWTILLAAASAAPAWTFTFLLTAVVLAFTALSYGFRHKRKCA